MSDPVEEPEALATDRLRFRRPRPEDLAVVFAVHGDPRTNVHNPEGPDRDRATSAKRLRSWLEHWDENGFGYWVVELPSGPGEPAPQVVGFTGVRRSRWLRHPVLNLYYRYAPQHWGNGYATEGARHALAWAGARRPELPVVAYTTLDNTGSQRTAVAAGLVRRRDLEVELDGVHAVVFASHWPYGSP